MGAIKTLCTKAMMLEYGQMKEYGDVDSVLNSYFKKSDGAAGVFSSAKLDSSEKVSIKQITLQNQRGENTENFKIGDDLIVHLVLESDEDVDKPNIAVGIKSKAGFVTIANTQFDSTQMPFLKKGVNEISIRFSNLPLLPQEYYLGIGMRTFDCKTFLMSTKDIGYFSINTRMSDLGINKPMAEEMAIDSVTPFIPYEWDFGNGNIQSFNILNNVIK
ncbi:MAG: Wzt carbohydrate-binding domain-containing protein, partial [Bacteroidetes bacterium]|nr:Wzt carbohydrate-binding domain-containing protein [Bacteroidota bacterium]